MKRTRSIIFTAVVSLSAVVAAGAWYTSSAGAGEAPAERGRMGEFEQRICSGEFDASSGAERVAERRESLLAEIAARADVEPAELEDAVRSVLIDRFDERLGDAVAAGRISEDQAEELAEAARSGTLADVLKEHAAERSGGRFERRGQLRDRIVARVCD